MFAANLRRLRLKRYESQQDWRDALEAEGVDVTRATIGHWERGFRSPEVDLFPAIARSLGVRIRTLFPEDDAPEM